jgi:septal ring factor EnvC (AmiA/AmiB activator)
MAEIQADPELVQQAYEQKLTQATREVVLLQAVATKLQQQVNELTAENKDLTATNQKLVTESGRQDGVPTEGDKLPEG